MYPFAGVAMTKYPKTGGLTNRNLFSHSSGGPGVQNRGAGRLVPSEATRDDASQASRQLRVLLDLQTRLPDLCFVFTWCSSHTHVCVHIFPLHKDTGRVRLEACPIPV